VISKGISCIKASLFTFNVDKLSTNLSQQPKALLIPQKLRISYPHLQKFSEIIRGFPQFWEKFYTFSIDNLYCSQFSTEVEDKFSFFSTGSLYMTVQFNIDNGKKFSSIFGLLKKRQYQIYKKAEYKKNKVDKSVNFVDNHLELCKSPSFFFHL